MLSVLSVLSGLLFGTMLWATGVQTSHNKAIDLEEERRRELLVQAFRLCPKGTEGYYRVLEAERQLAEKTAWLEDKLNSGVSINSNLSLWEVQSVTLEVNSMVDELRSRLREAGCVEQQ